MARDITQRELRNESGEVMRGLDRGEEFTVTRNGVPVGQLRPIRRDQFVATDVVLAMFHNAPEIDPQKFREDVDVFVSQDSTPHG